jgi:hypothetical protein
MPLWLKIPGYIAMLPYMAISLLVTLPFYGIRKIRWSEGCIEIIAKQKVNGDTRIFGNPEAQTLGFLIAHASERQWSNLRLRVHERRHVVQGSAFSMLTFILLPLAIWLGCMLGDAWWESGIRALLLVVGIGAWPIAYGMASLVSRIKYGFWYVDPDDRWTKGNVFENRAYTYDRDFLDGKHPGAWGSNP